MKKIISSIFICLCTIFISGCSLFGSAKPEKYQSYVKGLLDLTCKGEYEDYIKTTGEKKEDAEEFYRSNIEVLVSSLSEKFGIKSSDELIQDRLKKLSEDILKKTDYQVAKAEKNETQYEVSVTIKPMDFWKEANKSLLNYSEKIQKQYKKGKIDINSSKFEEQYADEILTILETSIDKIEYRDSVIIKIPIQEGDKQYSVKEEDLNNLMTTLIYQETEQEAIE